MIGNKMCNMMIVLSMVCSVMLATPSIVSSLPPIIDEIDSLENIEQFGFTHNRSESENRNHTNLDYDPDRDRNVAQIIRSRGFIAQEYDVITKDGYMLTIQRIVNPLIDPASRINMKPIILQHGLMSSSFDFVIGSVNVKPEVWPKSDRRSVDIDSQMTFDKSIGLDPKRRLNDTQEHPNALGFYMANRGYDVFLTNSRGNYYGQGHLNMSILNPKFWSFTFDEQIKFDLPDTIEFVQKLTNKTKIGYVGHSQGSLMMFGLMSERPEYADVIEPFVALAPVAYVSNCKSPIKHFSNLTPLYQHLNMNFNPPNALIEFLGPIMCGPEFHREKICANIIYLACGFDWDELDQKRIEAYMGHSPSGTSVKNVAHYGQMINSGKFAHFDHGLLGNRMRYNRNHPPEYPLAKIRSKSIVLFIATNDWLASPLDIQKLRRSLNVEPLAVYNITQIEPKWNHLDFVFAKHTGEIINTRIEQVFKDFS